MLDPFIALDKPATQHFASLAGEVREGPDKSNQDERNCDDIVEYPQPKASASIDQCNERLDGRNTNCHRASKKTLAMTD